jgi:hypothetical protein
MEVGKEIYRRLAKNDGLCKEDIAERLDVVRQKIKYTPSIQGLADGLRRERA